jgi:HEAT repeat protein
MKTLIAFTIAAWPLLASLAPLTSISSDAVTTWDEKEKDTQDAKVEKEQDLYEEASDAFDDHNWREAAKLYQKVADMRMSHADAALYWLAKSQNNLGMRSEALNTILDLQKSYPKSKWNEDAKALEIEVRQSAGQRIEPEHVADEELKLMALNGLMQSDAEQAIPIIERLLQSSNSEKLKDRALFVLSQSSSPRALDILSRTAKNGPPDLRARAIRYLGIMGGDRSRQILTDVYNSSSDPDVKKSILKSYMISGDRGRLLALAKSESDPDLRSEAVMQLGVMGAKDELSQLYSTEQSIDVRKRIIQAMFIGGNVEKLADLARNEPVLELKVAAIRNIGLLGGDRSSQFLLSLYNTDSRPEIRKTVINSLFIQGNARALVDLARREKDIDLKKSIVSKLSVMKSKEATDYLMEYLRE